MNKGRNWTRREFSDFIIKSAAENGISHFDAVMDVIQKTNLDYNEVPPLLSRNLKERLEADAMELRLMPKGPQTII